MAAQREKIIFDPDRLDAEQILPDPGEQLLDLIARSNIVVGQLRPRVECGVLPGRRLGNRRGGLRRQRLVPAMAGLRRLG